MTRLILHLCLVILLTLLTQLGGVAWAFALAFRRRILTFLGIYAALTVAAMYVAPAFGRVPLPCHGDGILQVQSALYCVLNRNYVTPDLRETAQDLALQMATRHPGTVTLVLDANFPFLDGFPMLPHLSHKDGRKLDIAFWYADAGEYLPAETRSPVGYFAFEPGETGCPPNWLTLRWNLNWMQPLWHDYDLDSQRMRSALAWLASDPRVEKIFVEPHLQDSLRVSHPKLRFQGCRAARHDDHIHFQILPRP